MRLLNAKSVEYFVVGGYAVAFHGYPRPTGDLAVWVSIHPNNVGKFLEVLKDFGFGGDDLTADVFAKAGVILRMGLPPVRIEIQTRISGVIFEECYRHRIVGEMGGETVSLINLDHLRQNKRAAGRPKDLADLENLA